MQSSTEGVTLVLGGARSGKSSFAERLVDESERKKIYLATSEVFDGEMENRIALHKDRRGPEWALIEEPLSLAAALQSCVGDSNCILVDCLTLWVTNLMMAGEDVTRASADFCEALRLFPKSASVVLVSNEVGQGIVPVEKMAREFRDYSGRLHQDIAAIAQQVWFVTAGLPQKLK